MTRCNLALLLIAVIAPLARADDLLTAQHAEHFAGSALIAGVATHFAGSELEGFGIAFGLGLVKEEVDQWHYRQAVAAGRKPQDAFTLTSLLADAAGSALGAKIGGLTIEAKPHAFAVGYVGQF